MPTPRIDPQISDAVLRPTHLEVDRAALRHNLAALRGVVGDARVMAVVKANAYGHGLVPVARLMEAEGVASIGVAVLEEGLRLREAGVKVPVLVMGGILGSQIPLFLDHDLMLTASSIAKLEAIEACAAARGQRARVHLKIDTGMERIGVHWYSAEGLLEASLRCPNVDVVGIFSHFANADTPDLSHARLQLERFLTVLDFYQRRSLRPPTRHIANSAAILRLPESHLDLVRPGIALYGVYPSPDVPRSLPLRPALTWRSRVVYFKVVRAGDPVSYGSTWTPSQMTRVVTVPVGYGDGYPRRMSGSAEVLLRGARHPVVGAICMDQVMVDIGAASAWNDDPVTLLGEADGHRITVEELAEWAGTIPYEILTGINARVPRTYPGPAPHPG
jgi:alanine racemase